MSVSYLDPSFGEDGKILGDGTRQPWAVEVQPDGKILVAGGALDESLVGVPEHKRPGALKWWIARYNADGTPDTSFDADGEVILEDHALNTAAKRPPQLFLQSDGRILMRSGGTLLRLDANGTLDTSFDAGTLYAWNMTVAPDDSIFTVKVETGGIEVRHYSPDGQFDPTFGGGGFASVSFDPLRRNDGVNETFDARSLSVAPDGDIYVVGTHWRIDPFQTVVARLNPDGTLDTTFGDDGLAAAVGSDGLPNDSAVTANGDLVFGLSNLWPATRIGEIVGIGELENPNTDAHVHRLSLDVDAQADGKVLVGGTAFPTASRGTDWTWSDYNDTYSGDFSVLRYNANGTLDETFGEDGRIIVNLQNIYFNGQVHHTSTDDLKAIAVQADGSIVAVGLSDGGLAIVRLMPEGIDEPGSPVAPPSSEPPPTGNPSFARLVNGKLIIKGTAGDDEITATVDDDQLTITLNGKEAVFDLADVTRLSLFAKQGNDVVTISDDILLRSNISGGKGNDSLTGGGGIDTIRGKTGKDTITGGDGADQLFGGSGRDRLFAIDTQIDRLFGGRGRDVASADADDELVSTGWFVVRP